MPASTNIDCMQPTPRGIATRGLRPDSDSKSVECLSSLPLTEAALAAIRTKET